MAKTYVMECYWPGVTERDHTDAVQRAEAAARALGGEGDVLFLGGSLVPSDEVAYYRFAARSAEDVEQVGEQARLPFDRVLEYIEPPRPGAERESRRPSP